MNCAAFPSACNFVHRPQSGLRHGFLALFLWGLSVSLSGAAAGVLRYCDEDGVVRPEAQSRLLQLSQIAKEELQAADALVALASTAGLDLDRLSIRYSHMGISVAQSPHGPWSVRQLYFDCAQSKSRLFDQGMAGFITGRQPAEVVYLSLVIVPPSAATALVDAALNNARALALLGQTYSANAYPFSTLYQNCNQWVLEMLASAWGAVEAGEGARQEAQQWLGSQGYSPDVVQVSWAPLMWLSGQIPWLHRDDHPAADQDAQLYRISLPKSIESFVQSIQPDSQRIELCMQKDQVVIRRGWQPMGPQCVPENGDEVRVLN